MLSTSKIRLILAALLLVAMFGVTAAPRVHANPTNTVTLNITGGNANALAACINNANHSGNGAGNSIGQVNGCTNFAFARGGNVILIHGNINALQVGGTTMGTPASNNAVNVTVSGGNATAVATCVNNANHSGNGAGNSIGQANLCVNTAIAIGGWVILVNTTVNAVQVV